MNEIKLMCIFVHLSVMYTQIIIHIFTCRHINKNEIFHSQINDFNFSVNNKISHFGKTIKFPPQKL